MSETEERFAVRPARVDDREAILRLIPRLTAFDVPASRDPRHLWMSDARTFERWCRGEEDACLVQVAVDSGEKVVGLAMATLRPELLSEEPSSHLEAIAVAEGMAGKGIGRLLLDAMEDRVRARGALSMSLHVFASNTRARGLLRDVRADALHQAAGQMSAIRSEHGFAPRRRAAWSFCRWPLHGTAHRPHAAASRRSSRLCAAGRRPGRS